jgi:hypothetical protein
MFTLEGLYPPEPSIVCIGARLGFPLCRASFDAVDNDEDVRPFARSSERSIKQFQIFF